LDDQERRPRQRRDDEFAGDHTDDAEDPKVCPYFFAMLSDRTSAVET
jgi:hypothetical protein